MRGGAVISDYNEFYKQWKDYKQRIIQAMYQMWDPEPWEKKLKELEKDNPEHLDKATKQLINENAIDEAERKQRADDDQARANAEYDQQRISPTYTREPTWGSGMEHLDKKKPPIV
jgi:hypothetical protein